MLGAGGASLDETPPPLNVLYLLETSTCVDLQAEDGGRTMICHAISTMIQNHYLDCPQ